MVLLYNELTEIDENVFERNTKWQKIYLYVNKIRFLHPNTFKNLKDFEKLLVSSNQLTSFDMNLLSATRVLRALHLNDINLTEICYHDLKLRLPQLSWVSFFQNNFNCSFAKQIGDYVKEKHIISLANTVFCVSDEEFAALVKDRHLYNQGSDRQLSVKLASMQFSLEQLNQIIVELKSEMMGLKFKLFEKQSVIDELQIDADFCCEMINRL